MCSFEKIIIKLMEFLDTFRKKNQNVCSDTVTKERALIKMPYFFFIDDRENDKDSIEMMILSPLEEKT